MSRLLINMPGKFILPASRGLSAGSRSLAPGLNRWIPRTSRGTSKLYFFLTILRNYVSKTLLFTLVFLNPIFAAATPRPLQFPLDHGKHATANMEWWNFYGHLFDANNHLFGFSVTFLRLNAPSQNPPSLWTTQDIYTSNFTITDGEQNQFYTQEKMNRTSFNFAGASDTQLLIWNRGWQAIMNSEEITLQAQTNNGALTLHLIPVKPILLLGKNGYFDSDNLYDYAIPRVQGHGELRLGGKNYQISNVVGGIEHGFQEKKNADTVWDKYLIHLNNGDDILIYILATKNSIFVNPESFCIISHADGTSTLLKLADFQFKQINSWYSRNSKTAYPSVWALNIPLFHYNLTIKPIMKNQEINSVNNTYWGGQSGVTGEKNGVPVAGYAYEELSKQMSRGYIL
jgi:predicted secreted hydrolase